MGQFLKQAMCGETRHHVGRFAYVLAPMALHGVKQALVDAINGLQFLTLSRSAGIMCS